MVWSISFFLFWRSLRSLEKERGMYIREPGESTSLFVTVASQNPMFRLIPFLSPALLTSVGLSGPGGVWGGKKYQPLLLQGYSEPQPDHHSYSSLSGKLFKTWKRVSDESFYPPKAFYPSYSKWERPSPQLHREAVIPKQLAEFLGHRATVIFPL